MSVHWGIHLIFTAHQLRTSLYDKYTEGHSESNDLFTQKLYIYIYIYVCVCVCVCVIK